MSDTYRTVEGLRAAGRINPRGQGRASNNAAALGLRYERSIGKELRRLGNSDPDFIQLEHNPWFEFTDRYGNGQCSPDFIIHRRGTIIVAEIKLTYTPMALRKLTDLYIPVIHVALDGHNDISLFPLVICKSLTPEAPHAAFRVADALYCDYPLLHWFGNGPLLW